jgi:hypothetical protein
MVTLFDVPMKQPVQFIKPELFGEFREKLGSDGAEKPFNFAFYMESFPYERESGAVYSLLRKQFLG